jgi:hypothetical protein
MATKAKAVVSGDIARFLTIITGNEISPVDGGFRIKETDAHYVDVLRMLVNWRVVTIPKDSPMTYDRHWCYGGTGFATLLKAVLSVEEWDGSDDTEPAGWIKNGQTGEWRPEAAHGR